MLSKKIVVPIYDNLEEKKETLGEVLNGDRLVSAIYELSFRVEKNSEVACRKNLTKEEVSQFRTVVAQDYYCQMFYDDLPIWSFLCVRHPITGPDDYRYNYSLFTYLDFEIFYNKEHVIEINTMVRTNYIVDLTQDKEVNVEFMYSVKWKETNFPFEKRMEKYYQPFWLYPYDSRIHWFSMMNSCLTVLILLGCMVMFYVRVLKKAINRYASDEELADNQEETGWKIIHGDVFRYPNHKSLFAAAVGSGTQLFILTVSVIMLGLFGVLHPYSRGALVTALVVIYAITSVVAGYTAVFLYCHQLDGINWVRNLLLTGCLFCGPLLLMFCFLNTVAIKYRATAALPQGTILVLFFMWLFGALPLLLLGAIAARNSKFEFQAPCRTTECPREIPLLRWYRGSLPQMAVAGILPFSVLYTELYYLFASMWGHRSYTIYGILFIIFVIHVMVTAFVTVSLTYFQLAAEDPKWWWRSFLCGGSAGLFIYGFCLRYYLVRSGMSGLLQISFFFGYMACICYGVFLMLGAIGFFASLLFVRHLYGSIKCE